MFRMITTFKSSIKLMRTFLANTSALNPIQYAFIAAGIAATIVVGANATSVSFPEMWTTVAIALL
jgi:Flp pilus assembly pilin Flp